MAEPHPTTSEVASLPARKRALVRQQIVYAGLALFGLALAAAGIYVGLAFTIIGASFAWLMVRTGRRIEAMATYFSAVRALQESDPARAGKILDDAMASGVPVASIPKLVAVVRAEAALQEGRSTDAIAEALDGLAAPVDRLDPSLDRSVARELRGIAAVAHATSGNDDAARALVAAIELDIASSPRALARAVIAAATVLARNGQKAELAERMARGRRILDVAGSTRERILARAFTRFASTPSPSVYRRAEVWRTVDPTDWIAAAAGDAAEFLPPLAATAHDGARVRAARATPRRPPGRRTLRGRLRIVANVAGLAFMFGVALRFGPLVLAQITGAAPVHLGVTESTVIALFVACFVFWRRVRKSVESTDRFTLAAGAWARGDTAGARRVWEELQGHANPRVAASASLALGSLALREGEPDTAAALAERGLGSLALTPVASGLAPLLQPELTALWAFGRASRAPQAAREAASSLPDYVWRSRAQFRVELVARVAEGDLARAARWADRADRDTTLDGFDEALADAVRLAAHGATLSSSERTRIATTLREPDKRAFLDGVAPGLATAALAVAASPEKLPPPATSAPAADEADLLAEEEAESASPRAHLLFTGRAS